MTSDGISDEDWDMITESAANLCNHTLGNRLDLGDAENVNMLYLLAKLTEKYGELPSLVATKADYVDPPEERLALWKRALELARVRKDLANEYLITESLRDFYTDESPNPSQAKYWGMQMMRIIP